MTPEDLPLSQAQLYCDARNARLSPMRTRVFTAIASHGHPIGAYDIAAKLSQTGKRVNPVSVYRALDWLVSMGLACKINSTKKYALGTFESAGPKRDVDIIFLCGANNSAKRVHSPEIERKLMQIASTIDFKIESVTIEVNGRQL
jgi:Fur family zinc uptake transcriptional regulator